MRRKSKLQCLLGILALALLAVSCTTTLRLSDGQIQPGEVALLRVQYRMFQPSARIESIDGKSIQKGHIFAVNVKEVDLRPGTHELEVGYVFGNEVSIGNIPLTFTCVPGGVYELHVAPIDEGLGGAIAVAAGAKGYWTAWIIDAKTKQVLAGKPRKEPLRWYEH